MIFAAIFAIIAILISTILILKLSIRTLMSFDEQGFHLEIKLMLYRFLTIFKWSLEDGGLNFLLKDKKDVSQKHKKKKSRLESLLNLQFSKDTYRYLKRKMKVFDISVRGRLATKDAARTALIYGSIWSMLGFLFRAVPNKNMVIDFYPDFRSDTPDFHISCILRLRIIHIIVLIVNNQKKRKGRKDNYGTASY